MLIRKLMNKTINKYIIGNYIYFVHFFTLLYGIKQEAEGVNAEYNRGYYAAVIFSIVKKNAWTTPHAMKCQAAPCQNAEKKHRHPEIYICSYFPFLGPPRGIYT
jgi:hypothetical protein